MYALLWTRHNAATVAPGSSGCTAPCGAHRRRPHFSSSRRHTRKATLHLAHPSPPTAVVALSPRIPLASSALPTAPPSPPSSSLSPSPFARGRSRGGLSIREVFPPCLPVLEVSQSHI
ncbi:hypothetical protein GUJ93_ZPchr0001g29907 [Zizania palustris]|uniref:Uncharacterized protein n=1 Tax=Zizania palustris TaxID=103762 RepID=A0A8J5S900_ZIZPA|nr:hypothetical protein GUJ93_ZPchr0001g29907 [Zizania palustris]